MHGYTPVSHNASRFEVPLIFQLTRSNKNYQSEFHPNPWIGEAGGSFKHEQFMLESTNYLISYSVKKHSISKLLVSYMKFLFYHARIRFNVLFHGVTVKHVHKMFFKNVLELIKISLNFKFYQKKRKVLNNGN